jgi:uncharacterized protein (TIGR00269 family)
MNLESKVAKTIRKFNLIKKGDKILCAVSGGKDSTTALHIVNKLFNDVEAITIDACIGNYTRRNLENIKKFCSLQKIKLHVVSFRDEFGYSLCYIRSALKSKGINMNSCAICGVLKRYLLNKRARELKKTVLVTGHNMDDEAQSIVMNIFRGNPELLSRLGPKTGVVQDRFVQRVKPLYLSSEKEIEIYSKAKNFPVVYLRCPCAVGSYRSTIRTLLNKYETSHPGTKKHILSYFLKIMPGLKRIYGKGSPNHCLSCGEPSRNELCKACEIISRIKN